MAADSKLRLPPEAGRRYRLLACVALLAVAPSLVVQAEETGEDQSTDPETHRLFFDSVDVNIVNVEVVVTDKQGLPISGLTRDDFDILEDGRPVQITNFHEVRVTHSLPEDESAKPPGEAPAPDAVADDDGAQRLVILVDNRNISPQSRKLLFSKLREHLRQDWGVAAEDQPVRPVMLATLDRTIDVVLPFTSDRDRILDALGDIERQAGSYALHDGDRRMFVTRLQRASLRGFSPSRSIVQGSLVEGDGDPDFNDAVRVALDLARTVRTLAERRYQRARATVDILEQFCEALGGMPDRKALIYLSDGLPLRPADALTEAWAGKFQNWALQNSSDIRDHSVYPNAGQTFQQVINSLASTEFDLRHELHRLTANASAQRVVFYPISTHGRSPEYLSASIGGGGINSGSGAMLRRAQDAENFTRDASLLRMADETGGQAMIRSANFDELLEWVDRDFSSYYALGYTRPLPEDDEAAIHDEASEAKPKGKGKASRDMASADKVDEDEGKFRKTEVRVKRDGALVRHGKGYNNKSWRQRLGAMTLASALFEVESNPLGVGLEPGDATPEGDRFRLPILLTVPFDQIRMVYHEEQYIAQLTAVVVVRNEGDGGLSQPQRIDFPIKVSGRRILEAVQQMAGYVLEIELDQGPKRIAVGLRDHFARTESTVNLGITVGQGAS